MAANQVYIGKESAGKLGIESKYYDSDSKEANSWRILSFGISAVKNMSYEKRLEMVWDSITQTRIGDLHPYIRERAVDFILSAQFQGINLRITTGYRSFEEQDRLYKQSITTGPYVTGAKGGESYHNYGLAIDVVEIRDGKAIWDCDWNRIADIGKEHGFSWGGDWNGWKDKPHFEYSGGYSVNNLYKLYSEKKFIESTNYLSLDSSKFEYTSPTLHPNWSSYDEFIRHMQSTQRSMS